MQLISLEFFLIIHLTKTHVFLWELVFVVVKISNQQFSFRE